MTNNAQVRVFLISYTAYRLCALWENSRGLVRSFFVILQISFPRVFAT